MKKYIFENSAIPKYKQRLALIEKNFSSIGFELDEWKKLVGEYLDEMHISSKDATINFSGTFFSKTKEKRPYFSYSIAQSEYPYPKGTLYGRFIVEADLEKLKFYVTAQIQEAGAVYFPGGYRRQRFTSLWESSYRPIDITEDPSLDVKIIEDLSREFEVKYREIKEETSNGSEKFNWSKVSSNIKKEVSLNVEDGDTDVTAYMQIGDRSFALNLYTYGGRMIHTRNLTRKNVNFSKIKVSADSGSSDTLSRSEITNINDSMSKCNSEEEIASILLKIE